MSLPNFQNPPVVEVACGFQFTTKRTMKAVEVGLFWSAVKADFPETADHPLLDEIPEPQIQPINQQVTFVDGGALPRVWMISKDEQWLIQLQSNRFHFNWRKIPAVSEYPRFEMIERRFLAEWTRFDAWATSLGLGPIAIVKHELTYVNIVDAKNGFKGPGTAASLFRLFGSPEGRTLKSPDLASGDFAFRMPNDQGMLQITFKSGMKKSNNEAILRTELTARGRSGKGTPQEWFKIAHEEIVNGFVDISTDHARTLWGLKR